MSNFNYSRFGITFRWIERYSRNTMIRVLFLALAVYLFILLMNTVTASYKGIPADMQLIGMALMFCLADVIRVALFAALGLDWIQWGIPVFFNISRVAGDMYILGVKSAAVYAACAAWLLWAQSLYVLGSILLNRYNSVIVSAIHVILIVALVWIVSKSSSGTATADITMTAETAAYTAMTAFALLGLFNWVMAYRLYSRMQVINNKLINL